MLCGNSAGGLARVGRAWGRVDAGLNSAGRVRSLRGGLDVYRCG